LPEAIVYAQPFVLGPGEPGKIRVRISGPDPGVLRELAGRAERILADNPRTKFVRSDWRERVKVMRPRLAEAQARALGLERTQVARALEMAVEGTAVGVYRERDELLAISARAPAAERADFGNLDAVQIWSPAAQRNIPLGQVVSGFEVVFEDPYIWRWHRRRTITLLADPAYGLPSELLAEVKAPIEQALGVDLAAVLGEAPEEHLATTVPVVDDGKIPLAGLPGYTMAWGGEAEDSARAQAGLAKNFPPILALMVLVVVGLFNSIKKTAIIWLTVPLALIGVTLGLLVTGQPFGFMALLGLLSLSGMLIKNAVVLIDEINAQGAAGIEPYAAIVGSGTSRLIPVMMAAGTTMLGMIPLFLDAFFVSMAVTIVFGLGFATVLTLVVVPVLYAILFRVPSPARS
jgi:multidrug efflux pump subunit AcrB